MFAMGGLVLERMALGRDLRSLVRGAYPPLEEVMLAGGKVTLGTRPVLILSAS